MLARSLGDALRGLGQGALDLFLPPLCEACGAGLGVGEHVLCARCRASLDAEARRRRCRRCAAPTSELADPRRRCPLCRGRSLAFRWTAVAATYEGAAKDLVLRFKYGRDPRVAQTLIRLLGTRLEAARGRPTCDALVPVPLHPRRERLRGFNQAELLALALGRRWRLPVWRRLLRRAVETPSQAGLARLDRLRNVTAAFAPGGFLLRRARGARLILVDDVISTGATADACARVLRSLGAVEVGVIAIAAAPA